MESKVICADAREALKQYPDGVFNLIVTSPPYADMMKRQYGGVSPDDYEAWFVQFHNEFWRVLAPNGSLVINIKDKVVDGVRHRYVWKLMMALSGLGWKCIDDYIWHKKNPMPGRWASRLMDGWEYCFHLAKDTKPAFYRDNVKKPLGEWAKNRLHNPTELDKQYVESATGSRHTRSRAVWKDKEFVSPSNVLYEHCENTNTGHPAPYPVSIPEFFIKLLTQEGDNVLDPFCGSGTTGVAAKKLNRNFVLIDIKQEYVDRAKERIAKVTVDELFNMV